MIDQLNETHDSSRRSWVPTAQSHPIFPLQNLPLGIFSPPGGGPRGGVAIGDEIFDLQGALEAGLFSGLAEQAARAAAGAILNPLMALGSAPRVALRKRLCALLAEDSTERAQAQKLATKLLHKAAECELSANTFPTATSTWCATWGGTRTPCVNMT